MRAIEDIGVVQVAAWVERYLRPIVAAGRVQAASDLPNLADMTRADVIAHCDRSGRLSPEARAALGARLHCAVLASGLEPGQVMGVCVIGGRFCLAIDARGAANLAQLEAFRAMLSLHCQRQ